LEKKRNLTLLGKINIVKTLGLSKLIYTTSVLVLAEQLIKEVNSIIFNFIWDGISLLKSRNQLLLARENVEDLK